jgi:hypothetical protein
MRQPDDTAWFEPTEAALRQALGEAEYDIAVTEGAAMGTAVAVGRALDVGR